MSVTILEALMNAEMNLDNVRVLGVSIIPIAREQLHNAIVLLDKGYKPETEVDPLLEQFGSVEDVPDINGD